MVAVLEVPAVVAVLEVAAVVAVLEVAADAVKILLIECLPFLMVLRFLFDLRRLSLSKISPTGFQLNISSQADRQDTSAGIVGL
jgi:hypothetical protein